MSDCCCSKPATDETIPTGWQCPCCKVVYAPNVEACYCCVEDDAAVPINIPVMSAPPLPPGPPVSTNPWFYTIQPPPYYTNLQITVEAVHAEG